MSTFRYEALHAHTGRRQTGTLEADSEKAARGQLRAQQLVPVKLQALAGPAPGARQGGIGGAKALNAAELAVWTRQLAGLCSAGMAIEKALHSIGDGADRPALEALMVDLLAQVKSGQSFSAALATHPRQFSAVFCAVVGVGEKSGALGPVLLQLADEMEASEALKAKLLGAALYPLIVSAIAVLIVGFLMVYVVPQIAGVFSSSKRDLPLLTTLMLAISQGMTQYGYLGALALLGLPVAAQLYRRSAAFQLRVDTALLRLPLLGRLSQTYNGARYAGTLGMLAGAGVPILEAMQVAAATVRNRAMRRDLDDVKTMVREGAPLGLALGKKARFPRLIATFAKMGAETGSLPQMLSRVSQQLSQEVQRRALYIATLLEPLLIVCMGVVVGLIVLAVLLPIIQLNSFVN